MIPRLEYIKQARARLGITQRKLATLTGISTSMINQIESGRCKPSYETARKIFEVLSSLEGRSAMKAGDICSRSPISVQKDEKLAKVMLEKNEKDLKNMHVSQVMEPPPPIVDVSTPAKALIPLVRFAKCILVSEKGDVIGIVTTTDTLKMVE